jgi:hypothetical protein
MLSIFSDDQPTKGVELKFCYAFSVMKKPNVGLFSRFICIDSYNPFIVFRFMALIRAYKAVRMCL